MKNIITFLLLYTILYSCDPDFYSDFYIENKTDKNLELVKFSSSIYGIKSEIKDIPANTSSLEYNGQDIFYIDQIYKNKDSIQIRSNGSVLKTYYKNDTTIGKSIYKMRDYSEKETISFWKEVESKDNYSKYVFEITEEDLKQ